MGKPVERECPACRKTYTADETRLRFGRETTCSRRCSYDLRAEARTKRVETACATCGKSMDTLPSKSARRKHGSAFCSRACHYAGRSVGATKRVVAEPYEYTPEGKAAMLAASLTPKGQRAFHPVNCTACGVEFDDPTDGRTRQSDMIFCSLACCNAYRKGPNNPAWRGGHPLYYGTDWRPLRRAARERDKVCQCCGAEPSGRELDVHHIRPVSSFDNCNDANTLGNVVTLCHPCHMRVEWEARG